MTIREMTLTDELPEWPISLSEDETSGRQDRFYAEGAEIFSVCEKGMPPVRRQADQIEGIRNQIRLGIS